eukprot:tig00021501_g21948.t1
MAAFVAAASVAVLRPYVALESSAVAHRAAPLRDRAAPIGRVGSISRSFCFACVSSKASRSWAGRAVSFAGRSGAAPSLPFIVRAAEKGADDDADAAMVKELWSSVKAIERQTGDPFHPDLLQPLYQIGLAAKREKKWEKAVECFERVLDIINEQEGTDEGEFLAEILEHIADVCEAMGDNATANEMREFAKEARSADDVGTAATVVSEGESS